MAGRHSAGRPLGYRRLDNHSPHWKRIWLRRSTAALKDTVLDKTRIDVSGRDVTFAADAFSEDGRRSAVGSVEAVPGVRLVNDETRLVPEAKPFVWSAERDVSRVMVGGNAPLPASKGKLLEAARASVGGIEVVDQMNLSRGAPPRFENAALLLLDQIGKLKDGKVTISDTKVSLSGMARDLGGREAIARRPEKSPRGFLGRGQRDQGAALRVSGLQGSGDDDADADRLRA